MTPSLPSAPSDDSLSMAFLLVLERLNPVERAVFLLREVFEYEYDEIANIVGRNEAACRQIFKRSRAHVTENRPRFPPSADDRARLLQRFQQASTEGEMEGLIALLRHDVVLYADGGGKTTAVPRPVQGAENVARFILRAPSKLLPKDLQRRVEMVNGQPAIISYLDGKPHSVFAIQAAEGRIAAIYIVSNPDKLRALSH